MIQTFGQLIIPIGLLILGFVAGKCIEKNHLRKLARSEADLSKIRTCNLRKFPKNLKAQKSFLVTGSAVIATDYFKVFAAGLRRIFGGEIKTYRSLMNRARREAVVRMLSNAREFDADIVWNIRFETCTIQGKKKAGGVEILAYGTAVKMS